MNEACRLRFASFQFSRCLFFYPPEWSLLFTHAVSVRRSQNKIRATTDTISENNKNLLAGGAWWVILNSLDFYVYFDKLSIPLIVSRLKNRLGIQSRCQIVMSLHSNERIGYTEEKLSKTPWNFQTLLIIIVDPSSHGRKGVVIVFTHGVRTSVGKTKTRYNANVGARKTKYAS